MLAHISERQISYSATARSLAEFLKINKHSPWAEVFAVTRDGFNARKPRKPSSLWEGFNTSSKNFVIALTSLNPKRKFTAHAALDQHRFRDVWITFYRLTRSAQIF